MRRDEAGHMVIETPMSPTATRRLRSSSGLCLAELLMVLATGAIVLAATLNSLDYFQRRFISQHVRIADHQDQRLALRVLLDELRIAGTGQPPERPALVRGNSQVVEFFANLNHLSTRLRSPATAGEQELQVEDGREWSARKLVWLCKREQCFQSCLAQDGRASLLVLTAPIPDSFPAGTALTMTNRVRYYTVRDARGRLVLMRQVDGGTNPILRNLAWLQFDYFDAGVS